MRVSGAGRLVGGDVNVKEVRVRGYGIYNYVAIMRKWLLVYVDTVVNISSMAFVVDSSRDYKLIDIRKDTI